MYSVSTQVKVRGPIHSNSHRIQGGRWRTLRTIRIPRLSSRALLQGRGGASSSAPSQSWPHLSSRKNTPSSVEEMGILSVSHRKNWISSSLLPCPPRAPHPNHVRLLVILVIEQRLRGT